MGSYMDLALAEARVAAAAGEVPVGGVVVRGGEVLARSRNRTLIDHDPTAHAEMLALRAAAAAIGSERLVDCDVYVTLEPCTMCAGALIRYSIARVVFGLRFDQMPASSRTAPGGYSSEPVFGLAKPPVEFVGGVLEEESRLPFNLHAARIA